MATGKGITRPWRAIAVASGVIAGTVVGFATAVSRNDWFVSRLDTPGDAVAQRVVVCVLAFAALGYGAGRLVGRYAAWLDRRHLAPLAVLGVAKVVLVAGSLVASLGTRTTLGVFVPTLVAMALAGPANSAIPLARVRGE